MKANSAEVFLVSKMTKAFVLLTVLVFGIGAYAQSDEENKKVVLSKVVGFFPFSTGSVNTRAVKDSAEFKGIPKGLKDYMIKQVKVYASKAEIDYQRFVKGELTAEAFISLYPKAKFPSKNRNLNARNINLLVGDLTEGEKIIIVDVNHNKDFSDDQIFKYEANPKGLERKQETGWFVRDQKFINLLDSLPSLSVPIEIFDGEKMVTRDIVIKCSPYNVGSSTPNKRDERFLTDVYVNEYRTGTFISGSKTYKIAVGNTYPSPMFQTKAFLDVLIEEDRHDGQWENSKKGQHKDYHIGDTISIDNFNYQLASVSLFGDTLTLARRPKVLEQK